MIRLRRAIIGAAAAIPLLSAAARADDKIRVIHTASSAYTAGFVALDKGFFAAHGLDVSFLLTAINSNIPAALVSGSAEIGGPTSPVLIQAVDGGLDMVAIAGTALAFPGATNEAAVTRPNAGLTTAKDYVGRRVGVPGIGTIVDILFRNWLMIGNVDPAKLSFVEVSGPQQADALRAGSVDAVLANDPQLFRMIRSGVGTEAVKFLDVLPGSVPIIVYAVTADYARTHRAAILAFKAALNDGAAYIDAHPDEAKASMATHLHLAPDVVKDLVLPKLDTQLEPKQFEIMIDILRRQQQVSRTLDPATLIFR